MGEKEVTSVVVLGMHRSGTSMVAAMLNALGVDMGEQAEHLKLSTSNPDGHFEDGEILKLNEKLLKAAGGTWNNPPKKTDLKRAAIANKDTISSILNNRQSKGKMWGWKEPRSCLTIEWFNPELRSPKFIVCRRDEVKVARSLARRNHLSYNHGIRLKKEYDASIDRFLEANPDAEVLELSYQEIVKEPQDTVVRLVTFLSMKPSDRKFDAAVDVIKPRKKLNKMSADIAKSTTSSFVPAQNKESARLQAEYPDWPLVSTVILSWNTLKDTKAAVHSLQSMEYPNHEIIVVDNGSKDGSKKWLRDQSGIILIDLPENTGFTGGNLIAEKEMRGNYLGLINSDAVVAKDWATVLVQIAEKDPTIGALGGRAYKWNDLFDAFDTDNPFYSFQSVNKITGYTSTETYGDKQLAVHSQSGAALMISRQAIEKVGYFDNRYFAYFEETDLIARMIRAGMKAVYVPQAHVWHKIAASTSGGDSSDFVLRQMARNRFIFAVKNFDRDYAWKFFRSYTKQFLGAIPRFVLRADRHSKAIVKGYFWNLVHIWPTLKSRRKVMKLGPTYSRKLLPYAMPDDVTIIIPNYNYANYVGDAIESALNQTHKPREIIVIDDGSTDNSRAVLKKYEDKVRVIYKENEGVIATKNLGIQLSRTYWTIFLDADDILDKTYLRKTVNRARKDKLDVVYSDMQMFGAEDKILKAQKFNIKRLLGVNYIHNSALNSTSYLKSSGGYKHVMSDGYEDWELYLNLAAKGAKMGYISQPLLMYRQHDDAMSRNQNAEQNAAKLHNKVRGLHPDLYKKFAPHEGLPWHKVKIGIKRITEHPFLLVVMAASLPKAVFAGFKGAARGFASVLVKNSRQYLHNKK